MMIDFKNIAPANAEHFKGGEGTAVIRKFEDKSNKIMLFSLSVGASVGVHSHEGNSEIVYIISGHGHFLYDDGTEYFASGSIHYCPMGHSHAMFNDGDEDVVYLAIVPEHH